MKIYIVVTDVVNDVTYSHKSVIHVWSYDFYDMTLSTGKQRRHMINHNTNKIPVSHMMRQPTICIGKNKGADQLCTNCKADQHLYFRYMASTLPLLSKSKISSL